jgi:hypothetical protein
MVVTAGGRVVDAACELAAVAMLGTAPATGEAATTAGAGALTTPGELAALRAGVGVAVTCVTALPAAFAAGVAVAAVWVTVPAAGFVAADATCGATLLAGVAAADVVCVAALIAGFAAVAV